MTAVALRTVIENLEQRAEAELAKPEDDPSHPTDRASALRAAANHFRRIQRASESATVALSEVIADMEEEVQIQENQTAIALIRRFIDQLKLVDAL